MDTVRCFSMHQRNAYAFQEAERDKALFIIPKPIVLEGERWASKDFLRINKVKAVILEVRSSLGFTPRKSHIESVYTYRIFVKGSVGSGLTLPVIVCRPTAAFQIHTEPQPGRNAVAREVRHNNVVGQRRTYRS
jgi:hypothetical protein